MNHRNSNDDRGPRDIEHVPGVLKVSRELVNLDLVQQLTARYGPRSRRAGIRESPSRTLTARAGRLPNEPRESEHAHPPNADCGNADVFRECVISWHSNLCTN